MTAALRSPSPRLLQLVNDLDSWAYGLTPALAEQVASRLQEDGFFDFAAGEPGNPAPVGR